MAFKFDQNQTLVGLVSLLSFLSCVQAHHLISKCVTTSLEDFIPTSSHNQQCNLHADLYRRSLNTSVYWAVNCK